MDKIKLEPHQKLICIAAVDALGGIGLRGGIPWDLPDDRAFFKAQTYGFPMIMGRKTFDSLGRKPLPGRPAAVWSRRLSHVECENLCIHEDLSMLLSWCFARNHTVFCIGGAQVYAALLHLATEIMISRVPGNWDCDVHFPVFESFHLESVQKMAGFSLECWKRIRQK